MISYNIGNLEGKSKYLKIEMMQGQLLDGPIGPSTRRDNEGGSLEVYLAPANFKADPSRVYWHHARNVLVECTSDTDFKYLEDGAPGNNRNLNGIGTALPKERTEIKLVDATPNELSTIYQAFSDPSRYIEAVVNFDSGSVKFQPYDFEIKRPPFGDLTAPKAPNYTNCNFINVSQRKALFFFKTDIPEYLLPLFGSSQGTFTETFDCQGDIEFTRTSPNCSLNIKQNDENFGAIPSSCRLVWYEGAAWLMTTLDFIPNTGEMTYNINISQASPYYYTTTSNGVNLTSKLQLMSTEIIYSGGGPS